MSESFKTRIGQGNVEVEVEFDYSPAEDKEEFYPGCQEDAEIESVKWNSWRGEVDVLDLLSEDQIEDLWEQAIKHVHSEIEQAEEEKGEAKYEAQQDKLRGW